MSSARIGQTKYSKPDHIEQKGRKQARVQNVFATCCKVGISATNVALIIIGCCATCGYLTGVVAGGCAVGLSVPLLLLNLITAHTAKTQNTKGAAVAQAIMMLAIVIIGSLGIAGIITSTIIGLVIITPTLISLVLNSLLCCCNSVVCCAVLGMSAVYNRLG